MSSLAGHRQSSARCRRSGDFVCGRLWLLRRANIERLPFESVRKAGTRYQPNEMEEGDLSDAETDDGTARSPVEFRRGPRNPVAGTPPMKPGGESPLRSPPRTRVGLFVPDSVDLAGHRGVDAPACGSVLGRRSVT